MKKLVCLVLSAILLLSCVSVTAFAADEEITLTVFAQIHMETTASVENHWWWQWVEHWYKQQGYNVKLDVTTSMDLEKLNVMMNTNKMPDILWGWDLGVNGIATYGVNNGQLLNMLPYMNEEIMPNWTAYAASEPMMAQAVAEHTAPNGELYTLPYVTGTNVTYNEFYGHERMYWNMEMLNAVGITKVPENRDELLAALRAVKANYVHPEGLEIYPATSTQKFLESYLTGSFGWQQIYANYNTITVKNGQVALAPLDPEFKDYVKFMNTLYTEGLIPSDFYTASEDTQRVRITNGQVALMGDWTLNTADEAHYTRWVGAGPLSENHYTINSPGYQLGWTFISSKTQYPELCAKLVDYMYSAEGMVMYVHGPEKAEDDPFGKLTGWTVDQKTGKVYYNDVVNGTYSDDVDYTRNAIGRFIYISCASQPLSDYMATKWDNDMMARSLGEFTDAITGFTRPLYFSLSRSSKNSDGFWRIVHYQAWKDNTTFTFLPTVFIDQDTKDEIADNSSGLYRYLTTEVTNMITGQKDIEESWDAFMDGLYGIGADRYLEIYQEVYADYIETVYGKK